MPGHYGMKKDKGSMRVKDGKKMMAYGDGGHHNPHKFGVEGSSGKPSNFVNPPKGDSKETK